MGKGGDVLRVVLEEDTPTNTTTTTTATATATIRTMTTTTSTGGISRRGCDISAIVVVVVVVVVVERLRGESWHEPTSSETHPPSDLFVPLVHAPSLPLGASVLFLRLLITKEKNGGGGGEG